MKLQEELGGSLREGKWSNCSISDGTILFPLLSLFCIFPSRAAQKLNLSSKKKKHRPSTSSVAEPPLFATSFSGILQTSPPPAPPCLLRAVNKVKDTPGLGKVGPSAISTTGSGCGVCIKGWEENEGSCLCVKTRRWQGKKGDKMKFVWKYGTFFFVTYTK